ncbi:MAG: murein L,D-transpeptidase, partial [Alphaproteobacteria bacterium]|nr:murein L,D-transpeptidase [Alphaproteobacteria bacterium]
MVGAKDSETALWSEPAPSYSPNTLALLKKQVDHYASLASAGGWPRVPQAIAAGQSGPVVQALRQRLGAEGDLDPDHVASTLWDQELTAAVKKFQGRMGLKQNGQVRGATLTALNIGADVRARQLAATYKRLSGINFSFGDRYIVVNIPSAAVEAVEKGRVAHRYVAVAAGR